MAQAEGYRSLLPQTHGISQGAFLSKVRAILEILEKERRGSRQPGTIRLRARNFGVVGISTIRHACDSGVRVHRNGAFLVKPAAAVTVM